MHQLRTTMLNYICSVSSKRYKVFKEIIIHSYSHMLMSKVQKGKMRDELFVYVDIMI